MGIAWASCAHIHTPSLRRDGVCMQLGILWELNSSVHSYIWELGQLAVHIMKQSQVYILDRAASALIMIDQCMVI